jgi:hypothetical protein
VYFGCHVSLEPVNMRKGSAMVSSSCSTFLEMHSAQHVANVVDLLNNASIPDISDGQMLVAMVVKICLSIYCFCFCCMGVCSIEHCNVFVFP